ncbi:uncharacterized protein H6S33_010350 [Morchella sextelata]|uniref:uncharacterized protein n=1 Tax=Morchella sextelata TaxID=1174677 RepID=UPI001D03FF0B|nr:uncharacterized protein H6S33_010350 [Morchella sextelata]KAH0612298.1 hypothetical protein H6S33_010350 [Morchella sextelata]
MKGGEEMYAQKGQVSILLLAVVTVLPIPSWRYFVGLEAPSEIERRARGTEGFRDVFFMGPVCFELARCLELARRYRTSLENTSSYQTPQEPEATRAFFLWEKSQAFGTYYMHQTVHRVQARGYQSA